MNTTLMTPTQIAEEAARKYHETNPVVETPSSHHKRLTAIILTAVTTALEKVEDVEINRRLYYQNITYSICDWLDKTLGNKSGSGVVCGTYETPSDGTWEALQKVTSKLSELQAERDRANLAFATANAENERLKALEFALLMSPWNTIEEAIKYLDDVDVVTVSALQTERDQLKAEHKADHEALNRISVALFNRNDIGVNDCISTIKELKAENEKLKEHSHVWTTCVHHNDKEREVTKSRCTVCLIAERDSFKEKLERVESVKARHKNLELDGYESMLEIGEILKGDKEG